MTQKNRPTVRKKLPTPRNLLPLMKHEDAAKLYLSDRTHSPSHPHWSEGIEWRDGRWDPMSNAPMSAMDVRGRDAQGKIIERMHYAEDLSGECQPPFCGWFEQRSGMNFPVSPVEWQPLRAKPHEEPQLKVVK